MKRLYAWLTGLAVLLITGFALANAPASSSSAGAAPSASSSALAKGSEIKIRDTVIVVLRVSRGDKTAAERARVSNQVIETLLEKPDEVEDVHVDESAPGAAVIYAGKTPVLTLGDEDTVAADEPSLHVLAGKAAQRLDQGIHTEQKRSRIATTVFSLSLVVFSGLIAFLLLGRVGEVAARIRAWLTEHPDRLAGLRLGNIEVLSVAAVRGAISIGVFLLYRLSQVAIVYGWLIFALSLFESTRGYTDRLGGFVLAPISALVSRVGGALPLLVIVLVAGAVVFVLIRFVGLFLESVARGETRIAWMPADFAKPISLIVRIAIVIAALLVATPLITGSDDGAFSRAGLCALVALGLASTPVLASAAAGSLVVFGRKMKRGDYVELGPRAGRVIAVSLLEVRLLEREGSELRVPHLLGLWQPTRIIGKLPLTATEIVVRSEVEVEARRVIDECVRALGGKFRIQLLSLDDTKAHYRITAEEPASGALEGALRKAVGRIVSGSFHTRSSVNDLTPLIHTVPPSIPPPSAVVSPAPPSTTPSVSDASPSPPSTPPSTPPPAVVPPVQIKEAHSEPPKKTGDDP
jgi:small-conductance mechanosensitive channel